MSSHAFGMGAVSPELLAQRRDGVADMVLVVLVALAALVGLVAWAISRSPSWRLWRMLYSHFGGMFQNLPVVDRNFSPVEWPNLQMAIGTLSGDAKPVGIDRSLHEVARAECKLAALRYQDVDVDFDRRIQCVENALYLFRQESDPVVAFMYMMHGRLLLQVMAKTKDIAARCIDALRQEAGRISVYRGKVISLEQKHDSDYPGWLNIRFHRLAQMDRGDIVLPAETMALIERNTVGFYQNAAALRRAGRSLKRGLLFHGEPGTGKTCTARWLAQSLPKVTVLQVSGEQLWNIHECCQLARRLAPSLVILEDVDLIATNRDQSGQTTALHQLMNEMDGLDSEAEVIFLLTTNRPDVIEPALANRPGRIDQAIRFPLPDAECRRRLLELYGQGLRLDLSEADSIIRRTDGASPAFIQELVRKAALVAAQEESTEGDTLHVRDAHLHEALRELTLGDGELTRRLLGFATEKE